MTHPTPPKPESNAESFGTKVPETFPAETVDEVCSSGGSSVLCTSQTREERSSLGTLRTELAEALKYPHLDMNFDIIEKAARSTLTRPTISGELKDVCLLMAKDICELLQRTRDSANVTKIAQYILNCSTTGGLNEAIGRNLITAKRTEGWQDISTAPRDGAYIRLWAPDYRAECPETHGYWCEKIGAWSADSGTMEDGPAWHSEMCNGPTHWMPLPAQPTAEDGGV